MTISRRRREAQIHDHLAVLSARVRAQARSNGLDLGYADYTVLSTLARLDEPSIGDVAEAQHIDKSTASRQVSALERRGLVTRQSDSRHPRAQRLSLTPKAQSMLDEARSRQLDAIADRVSDWTAGELAGFVGLLERYNEAG